MRRAWLFGCVVALSCLGAGLVAPSSVLADCQGGPQWTRTVDRAQGETFVGVFRGATKNGEGDETFHWTVEHVYAGNLHPGRLDGWGTGLPSCHPAHFHAGVRYLVSSDQHGGGDAFDVAAYVVLDHGRIQLIAFEGKPSEYPIGLRVDTLAEALAVLVTGLPPTDTADPATRGSSVPVLPLGLVLVAILATTFSRRLPHAGPVRC